MVHLTTQGALKSVWVVMESLEDTECSGGIRVMGPLETLGPTGCTVVHMDTQGQKEHYGGTSRPRILWKGALQ